MLTINLAPEYMKIRFTICEPEHTTEKICKTIESMCGADAEYRAQTVGDNKIEIIVYEDAKKLYNALFGLSFHYDIEIV